MIKFEGSAVAVFCAWVITMIFIREIRVLSRYFICKFKKKTPKPELWTKSAVVIHVLSFLGIVCIAYSFFIEPYWIDVKELTLYTEKLKGTSLKVVQISDLHCDTKVRNEDKLVEIINSLEPDIVVFTGDALNTSRAIPLLKNTLKRLNAGLGKFLVLGNFEVWYWSDMDLFGGTGFKILNGEKVLLSKGGESFFVSGLSYDDSGAWPYVLEGIPSERYSIFLYHTPDLIEDLKGAPVDLYLAGHTHGGQVRIPFYGAIFTMSKFGKKYEMGRYKVNDIVLYVNRGMGMEGGVAPRVRFLARPEITVFNIHPK